MDALIGWPGGDWLATLKLAAVIGGGYLSLIWVTTVLWTYRDIRSRSRDPISQAVGVALSLIPFVGMPLYLVVRPSENLQQVYARQLEQEAILSELHSVSACPNCRRPVQDEFMACPYCRTSLKEPCGHCGQLMTHAWQHCPYCATTREPARSAARLEFDEVDKVESEADRPETETERAGARTQSAALRPDQPPNARGEPATR